MYTTNEAGESHEFMAEEMSNQDDWWKVVNADFTTFMESKPELHIAHEELKVLYLRW